ncbi:MAG: CDP-glycerol glycerophosphotransferase family protein [Mogibacterium sp.]|nr:CDP-glycerol glycerophosphotransferase family protein [Mogibacterium sp.]
MSEIRIKQINDKYYLYLDGELNRVSSEEKKDQLYNTAVHIASGIDAFSVDAEGISIKGTIGFASDRWIPEGLDYALVIGNYTKQIALQPKDTVDGYTRYAFDYRGLFREMNTTTKSATVFIQGMDRQGYGFRQKLKYRFTRNEDTVLNQLKRRVTFSNLQVLEDSSAFLQETWGNNVVFTYRNINVTDSPEEQKKLKRAYLLSRILWFHRARKCTLFFEKFAEKYEESASVLFEKVVDSGVPDAYFIIDTSSPHFANIPEKYKSRIIPKYSFKHYFYFFLCRKFIATESMNHCIELNIADSNVRTKIQAGDYDYIFLQHGVMYMYCLQNREDFCKGGGFSRNSKIVVSSKTEAKHFIDYGRFEERDLILSGLPKFDRCVRKPDADRILIMPTSRDFEYNVIRLDPTNSTYYRFVKNIIREIPDELKDKVIVVGHPLLRDHLYQTDLAEYMPKGEFIYNELLQQTRLLITDYSSISYDAFYRGCNVIFAWEDKEMCLGAMNYKLMLDEENAFADISHDFSDLGDLIRQNYYGTQKDENIQKYRDIVMFHDNQNAQRCFNYLKDLHMFDSGHRKKIKSCKMKQFTSKVYTGDPRIHTKLEIIDGNINLIRGRDYRIWYWNNRNVGRKAVAVIIGAGRYYGLWIRRFQIKKAMQKVSVAGVEVSSENELILDNLILTDENGHKLKANEYSLDTALSEDRDYITLTIKGKDNYGGTVKKYYKTRG